MKKIELTKGHCALVDDEDFERVSKWRWKYHKDGYAVRSLAFNKQVYMHRFINNTPRGFLTDHINRDGLDNRKENLRTVNYRENAMNTGLWKHNSSGVKGVFWNKQKNKWNAQIMVNKKNVHLGLFVDINEAKKAREKAEVIYAVRS